MDIDVILRESVAYFEAIKDKEAESEFAESPDLTDEYVDRLQQADMYKPWLDRTQELLSESADLNEFSDKLDELYPDLSSVKFAEAMRSALTAASMAGYFEASEEIEGTLEFKMQEGTTKVKDGVTYILTNSRWRRAEPKPKAEKKPKAEPKSKAERKPKKSPSKVIAVTITHR